MPEFKPNNVHFSPEEFFIECDDDERAYLFNCLTDWIQDLSDKRIKELGLDETLESLKGIQP